MQRFIAALFICALAASPVLAQGKGKGSKPAEPAKTVKLDLEGAADGPVGIGVFIGEPSGLNVELDLSETSWLDFKAAWSFAKGAGDHVILQANYEQAFPAMLAIETETFTPFVGAGALVDLGSANGVSFGIRVPGGLSYRFRQVPLELFLELGLDLAIVPEFDVFGSGGLGIRYRF